MNIDSLNKEQRESVNYVITASQNLLEIVNGILDISKIEANKLDKNFQNKLHYW